jgi:hypothetical protein
MTIPEIRAQIITALGGKCVECGISDIRVLDVDHKFGQGYRDRKFYSGLSYYKMVLRNLCFGEFQILCANHHRIKTHERLENTGRKHFDPDDLEDLPVLGALDESYELNRWLANED